MTDIAQGVIVMWSGSLSSIPTGWSRVDSMQGYFTRQSNIAGNTNSPSDHNHSYDYGSHDHGSVSHSHGSSSVTFDSADTGSQWTSTAALGSHGGHQIEVSHDHTSLTILNTNMNTQSQTSSGATNSSDPDDLRHYTVHFIQADEDQSVFPSDSLIWINGDAPTGWSTDTSAANNRYMKGINGTGSGSTGGSNEHGHSGDDNHTHDTDPHGHTIRGPQDDHPSVNAFVYEQGGQTIGSDDNPTFSTFRRHRGDTDSTSQSIGRTSGEAQNANHEPSYFTLRPIRADSDQELLEDLICIWIGSSGSIPHGWHRCDGEDGTPNIGTRFVKNSSTPGATGGGEAHSHTHSHNHSFSSFDTNHKHTASGQTEEGRPFSEIEFTGDSNPTASTHQHTISGETSEMSFDTSFIHTDSVSTPTDSEVADSPLNFTVHYIQFTGLIVAAPTLIQPLGQISDISPTFEVNADDLGGPSISHTWYEVQEGTSGPIMWDSGWRSGTTSSYLGDDLIVETQYRWRAKNRNTQGDEGPWSDWETFTTPEGIDPPTLIIPSGEITTDEPEFETSPNADNVVATRIEIREIGSGSTHWDSGWFSGTSTIYDGPQLESLVEYEWRARSRDSGEVESDFSGWDLEFVIRMGVPPPVGAGIR